MSDKRVPYIIEAMGEDSPIRGMMISSNITAIADIIANTITHNMRNLSDPILNIGMEAVEKSNLYLTIDSEIKSGCDWLNGLQYRDTIQYCRDINDICCESLATFDCGDVILSGSTIIVTIGMHDINIIFSSRSEAEESIEHFSNNLRDAVSDLIVDATYGELKQIQAILTL